MQVPTIMAGETKANRDVQEKTSPVRVVERDRIGAEWSMRASKWK